MRDMRRADPEVPIAPRKTLPEAASGERGGLLENRRRTVPSKVFELP